MAVGDRVVVGDGQTWSNEITIPVYEPRWLPNGHLDLDHSGAAQIVRLGGAKGGFTGTIEGPSIRVHRNQLLGETSTATMGGVDLVHLFPVMFDVYQRVAWVPAHHMRIVAGGTGLNLSDRPSGG